MPVVGSKATASWAKRPAFVIGSRFGLAVGRDLEEEPVTLLQRDVGDAGEVRPDVRAVDRLLARDPASPRHAPAGTVHLGAVEAGVGLHDVAEQVDHDGRRAAAGLGVVRRARTEGRGRPVDLVVADEDHVAVRSRERGHAVVAAGQGGAVAQGDRGTRCRGTTGTGSRPGATAARRHRVRSRISARSRADVERRRERRPPGPGTPGTGRPARPRRRRPRCLPAGTCDETDQPCEPPRFRTSVGGRSPVAAATVASARRDHTCGPPARSRPDRAVDPSARAPLRPSPWRSGLRGPPSAWPRTGVRRPVSPGGRLRRARRRRQRERGWSRAPSRPRR